MDKQIHNYDFLDNLQYIALIEEPDGTIKYANRAFCDFYGIKQEDVIGTVLFDYIIPEDRIAINMQFVVTPDRPEYRLEGRTYDKNGNLVWLQFVGKGFFNTKGELIEFQEIAEDITGWKEKIETEVIKMSKVRGDLMNETEEPIVPDAVIDAGKNAGNLARYRFEDIVTRNEEMETLIKQARYVAGSNAIIMIEGETGTGKELFAQAIHNESKRRNGPFVAVNCGSIAPELLQSELFGYVGGAFTGADKNGKIGKFELANDGTLFLDEIGEMPFHQQVALLRSLETKTITKIGDNKVTPVNARIICATNKDLFHEVVDGRFRADLYFRLNVINLRVPPLRKRKEDIYPLMQNILGEMGIALGQDVMFSKEEMRVLYRSEWPGNVRELRNVLQRKVYMPGYDLKQILRSEVFLKKTEADNLPWQPFPEMEEDTDSEQRLPDDSESALIEAKLTECRGNVAMAARELGVSRKTIYTKIRKYGLTIHRP